ncbi:KdsC family phosphatase [Inmirania thermothiophila]|uniref:3-deoxy-D-manno-octulosonate 8-phosphate phosphatase KdsC n=1 Tax=Inmirania thermothiophila TaxID=1750597 RepID=A0A3N1XX22_9GAMM|nr:HAD-IIIA family hydrolase [Inmirania thermothiophila]ROR29762.1 3-deoxy-D-manno-octulosonate 8-phosphate phosphatase (KDO 8-P phosphatase) [Inmirania thermothiophila]
MRLAQDELVRRAAGIRLLVLDVDGVLTDGRLYVDEAGRETKAFHVRDGHGIKLAHRAGIAVALVSGRRSGAVDARAAELGIGHVCAGVEDKAAALARLCRETGIDAAAAACVGDDVVDLPMMAAAGLAVAVADAHPAVLARAHWVTSRPGGAGAVREVCDLLLAARGEGP